MIFLIYTASAAFAQTPLEYEAASALLDQSPRVRLAQGQLDLAQKQLEVTATWLQASLSGGYTLRRSTQTLEGTSTSDTEGDLDPIGLDATFNVVPYGPWQERVQRQRWAVERARLALRDERAEVLITVTEQFASALRAKEEVALATSRLELARLQLEAVETQLEAGAATPSGLLEAELSVQSAQQDLLSAERGLAAALGGLGATLGEPVADVAGDLPETKLDEVSTDTEARLEARLDVVDARLNVLEAELNAGATLRENLPSGSVNLGYSLGNTDSSFQLGAAYSVGGANAYQPSLSARYDPDSGPAGLAAGDRQSFSVGVDVVIPLDTALPDALAAARMSVETARLGAEQTLRLARLDIVTARDARTGAEASLALSQSILSERERSLETTQQRFELGLVPQLEVAQARVNVADARLNLRRAEDALRLATLRYARALALPLQEVF